MHLVLEGRCKRPICLREEGTRDAGVFEVVSETGNHQSEPARSGQQHPTSLSSDAR
jgi:hypothetical protein